MSAPKPTIDIDDILGEYIDEHEATTSERILESAVVADFGEMVNGLNAVVEQLRNGDTIADPAFRADILQRLEQLRHVIANAERILKSPGSHPSIRP